MPGMEVTTEEARGWTQTVVLGVATLTLLSLTSLATANVLRRRRFPPGPRGFPIFGSLFALGPLPHQSLHKLAQQYGPLMFMHLGSVPALVVSNSKMAEMILRTKDQIMASRPDMIVGHKLFYDSSGISFVPYSPSWRYARKICTVELFTTYRINQYQGMRQREVLTMLHSILETCGREKVVVVNQFLYNLNFNNITQMMLNKSYCFPKGSSVSTGDELEAATFREIIREIVDLLGQFNLSDFIPIVKRLPFDLQGYNKRLEAVHKKLDAFLGRVVDEHRQRSLTGKQEKSTEDFVDVLLALGNRNEAEDGLSKDSIKAIIAEMIAAATDSGSTTVEWALTELVRHPSILKRAQEELDLVVGRHRLVDEADLPELKFIGAVVKEAFRLHPPAPLLIPHESMQECEIAGYHIPSGTRVLVNVWSLQRDPLVYERPLEFDPDRFLHSATDVKGNDFGLLPFGSGRRVCPGMNLGLLMVHYSLAQMLHTMSWTLPEDQKPEELDVSECFGLVCPKAIPLRVVAKQRLPTSTIDLSCKPDANGDLTI